jgi:hypothetical protein
MPGERRGGRKRATPNRRTILADRIMVVLAGCSAVPPKERLAKLVNDQELPADIRVAVAQRAFVGKARRPARRAKSERTAAAAVETMSRDTLDALLGIVADANAPVDGQREAAMKAATYFLPMKPANKRWRFTADECGFAINAEIAREYRSIDFELRPLKRHPGRNYPEIAQRITKLEARRNAISQRLKCPCPTLYTSTHFAKDYLWLATLARRREDGNALTAEEGAEEAHRKARADCYAAGPEQSERRRREELEAADLLFRKNRFFEDPTPPPLSRKECYDLWRLRWLYPPYYPKRHSEAEAQREASLVVGSAFREAEPTANGSIYGPDSKLWPANVGEPDSIEGFTEFTEMPPYCIAISGQPLIFTYELPDDLLNNEAKPSRAAT